MYCALASLFSVESSVKKITIKSKRNDHAQQTALMIIHSSSAFLGSQARSLDEKEEDGMAFLNEKRSVLMVGDRDRMIHPQGGE